MSRVSYNESTPRYSQDIGEIRSRVSELERGQQTEGGDLGPPMLGTGLDLSVASQGSRDSVVDTDEVDFAANVSQTNKQLDETTVTPTQVSFLALPHLQFIINAR